MQHLRIFTLALLIVIPACTTGPSGDRVSAPEHQEVYHAVLTKPLAVAQQTAVEALESIGCVIKQRRPRYVEGFRPHQIGFVIGSGGETVRVWLSPISARRTGVKVATDKSLLGIAGQRTWDHEVIAQMKSR
jgi:hypothetical protein